MGEGLDPRQEARRHLRFFEELGVAGLSRQAVWQRAHAAPELVSEPDATGRVQGGVGMTPDGTPLVVPPTGTAAAVDAPSAMVALRDEVGPQCTRCKLATLGRRQVVFGVGNPHAELMFVGEAPGSDEDLQGEPFVGRAGQLLTKMIEAMGHTRQSVYIANVIKCRPPGNRNPEPDEVATCEPFLLRQIDIIQPRVVVALGKFAAQTLLRTDTPITRLRGQVYTLRGAALVPTFHPAYLLRSPDKKRDAWDDLKKVMALLREEA